MSRVVVFLAEGFEEIEALTVVDVLRRGNVEVESVSVSDKIKVTGAHNIEVKADRLFDKTKEESAEMVVLPGGYNGMLNLKAHSGVNEVCAYLAEKDKYVTAICAAPSVLGVKGLLKGKRAVCYPGFEEQLEGAEIGRADEKVVVDGRFVTSKGPGTAADFALTLLALLAGEETADKVKAGMLL
jgi:4-methyl-5(b-hydroxyethyl)-thiazole monophosphate biosynthesis